MLASAVLGRLAPVFVKVLGFEKNDTVEGEKPVFSSFFGGGGGAVFGGLLCCPAMLAPLSDSFFSPSRFCSPYFPLVN